MNALIEEVLRPALELDLTEPTADAATRCLVDWAGCGLAGSVHEVAGPLASTSRLFGRGVECTVVGSADRAAPFPAALWNGTVSHVLDLDDVNPQMKGHPAVVVIPAVLALAEPAHADGARVGRAIVIGYEVCARLGPLVGTEPEDRGWHPTATLGCLGAAAAAATLLGLSATDAITAMGLAATQASGVRAMFGSHGKSMHAGRAAAVGLQAASLVQAGFVAPPDSLTGRAGYFHAAFQRDLGSALPPPVHPEQPAILRTAFKRHAACGATHSLIDVVAGLVAEYKIAPADITGIEARVHPLALVAAGLVEPQTGLEAKFSLSHLAAMAAHTHPLGPDRFADDIFSSPSVERLRSTVQLEPDHSYTYDEAMPAEVTIALADGGKHTRFLPLPKGRPSTPFSDTEMDEKFINLATPVLGADRSGRALAAMRGLVRGGDCTAAIQTLGGVDSTV